MPVAARKVASAFGKMLPGRLRQALHTNSGRRMLRFAPAALMALAATQITYFIMFSVLHAGGLTSGAVGWFAGFVVSYGLSRWAWERKGKPDVLRETLPFLAVSLSVGVILTLTSKFASTQANALGLTGVERALFAQSIYLTANCATFLARFMIFHHVLFADSRDLDGDHGGEQNGAASDRPNTGSGRHRAGRPPELGGPWRAAPGAGNGITADGRRRADDASKPGGAHRADDASKPDGAHRADDASKPGGADRADAANKPGGADQADAANKPGGAHRAGTANNVDGTHLADEVSPVDGAHRAVAVTRVDGVEPADDASHVEGGHQDERGERM